MNLYFVIFVCYMAKNKVSDATEILPCTPGHSDDACCLCPQEPCHTDVCPTSYYAQSVPVDSVTCLIPQTTTPADDTTTTVESTTTGDLTNITTGTHVESTTTGDPTNITTQESVVTSTLADEAITTQSDVNSTESADNVTDGTTATPDSETITICTKCNPACKTCNGSTISDCVECTLMHNGTCVKQCPAGFEPSTNLRDCVSDNDDDDSSSKTTYIIIGAAAGGGVLIICVVILCCCLHRRRRAMRHGETRSKRTAMSTIIQTRDEEDKPSSGEVGGPRMGQNGSKVPSYENTSCPQPGFAVQVQQQGDTVLRYTRDPTFKQSEPLEAGADHDSTYANSAMVKLHSHTDVTNLQRDTLERELDKIELEDLPAAPSVPPTHPTPQLPGQRKKSSIIKRLSMKLGKPGKKQDKPKVDPPVTAEENYVPMGASVPGDEEQQVYEAPDGEQEVYENQEPASGRQSGTTRRDTPAIDAEEDYENYDMKQHVEKPMDTDVGGEEDYENYDMKQHVVKPMDTDVGGEEVYENWNNEVPEEDYENTSFRFVKKQI